MSEEMIKVIKVEDHNYTEKEIKHSLESLQKEVGGLIEIPYLSEILYKEGIDMIINEEGKLLEMQAEAVMLGDNNEIVDIICGPILFASHDDEGNTTGLSKSQIKFLNWYLKDVALLKLTPKIGEPTTSKVFVIK